MSLQKTIVSIPIAEGLDTKTDDKLVPAGKSLVLENARFQKTGRLSKRFGLVVSSNSSNYGPIDTLSPYAIASDDNSLYCLTSEQALAYKSSANEFVGMNYVPLSPSISTEYKIKSIYNERIPDFDYNEAVGLMAICSTSVERQGVRQIKLVVEDINTKTRQQISIPAFSSNPSSHIYGKVRVIGSSDNPAIFIAIKSGAQITVNLYSRNLVLLNSVPITVPQSTIIDAARDTLFRLAYISDDGTSSLIRFVSYDELGASVSNATYPLLNRIGVAEPTFNVLNSFSIFLAGGKIHACYIDTTGSINFFGVNSSNLANSLPQFTITTIPVKNLAICADGSNVYVTAGNGSSVPSQYENIYIKVSYSLSYSFVSSGILLRMSPACRPFIYNGKPYGIAKCSEFTRVGTNIVSNRNQYLIDLENNLVSTYFCEASALEENLFSGAFPATSIIPNTVVSEGKVFTAYNKKVNEPTGDVYSTEFSSFLGVACTEMDFSGPLRAKVKVGQNLFISNGQLIETDRVRFMENGFLFVPQIVSATPITTGTSPDYSSKTINYICVYEYYDSNGNLIESAPSSVFTINTPSVCNGVTLEVAQPSGSLKFNGAGSIGIAIYRTEGSGTVFYKSITYGAASNIGSTGSYGESVQNSDLINNKVLYTSGGVLENNPAPNAKYCISGGQRMFLLGLEDGDIAYSKKQLQGESVNFNSLLRIRISSGENADVSKLSALGYMDGKLIIFRERSIYFIQGDGPLETGLQDTFTEPEVISSDAGCVDPRSVLNVPMGVMFKSRKGIYLLDRALSTQYIGASVEDFNSERIVSSIVSDKFNEARFYTDQGNCLAYNYLFNTWSVFKDQTSIDADIWQGSPVSLVNNKVAKETENTFTDDGDYYSMRLVTPWLKLQAVQDFQRIYRLWIIGNYKSAHTLKLKIYVNYDETEVETYDLVYNPEEVQYQFRVSMPFQKVESIKFELYDTDQDDSGESFDLTNLQAEVGLKQGGYKIAATKSF